MFKRGGNRLFPRKEEEEKREKKDEPGASSTRRLRIDSVTAGLQDPSALAPQDHMISFNVSYIFLMLMGATMTANIRVCLVSFQNSRVFRVRGFRSAQQGLRCVHLQCGHGSWIAGSDDMMLRCPVLTTNKRFEDNISSSWQTPFSWTFHS